MPECLMETYRVEVDPPRLNDLPRLLQRRKPVAAETLGAQASVGRQRHEFVAVML